MANISVVIIVKNGAQTIEKTLRSVQGFDDVVVYDNGSTDHTCEIAKKFTNVNLVRGEFLGFGQTKNDACTHAKYDWVLSLDADEVVDEPLQKTLSTYPLNDNTIYSLNFWVFYKDIQIKHCGWSNQKVKRLFNRTQTSFNLNHVHEEIITAGMTATELLGGNIKHYSYQSISEFIIKADRYSTLFANDNAGKKSSSPSKAFFNGIYSFIKTYFFKRGFLDGYVGLLIAFSHMTTNFYKYLKLYELNKEMNQ